MSCHVCNDLSPSLTKNGLFGDNKSCRVAISELERTAKAGCSPCNLLLRAIANFEDIGRVCSVRAVSNIETSREAYYGQRQPLQIWLDLHDGQQTRLTLYTDSDYLSKEWPLLVCAPHVSQDSSSSSCLDLARNWLDECMHDTVHAKCSRETGTPLPTRVVNVGNDEQTPFLYKAQKSETDVYAALSYCWGSGRTFTTTTASYESLKNGFALVDLPKTIHHAITITRGLKIQYLWIDQLCIIQDDLQDWKRESGRMCSVYNNASVTLAALDSPTSDTGLFLTSPSRNTVRFETRISDNTIASLYVRKADVVTSQGFIHRVSAIKDVTSTDILETRGWTMQEIALSPRILWFTSSEMAWSCLQSTACECDPGLTADWNEGSAASLMGRRQSVASMSSDFALCMEHWQTIVEQYTNRLLSNIGDRLHALAGLAAAFQAHTHGEYVSGLWRRDLANQLLWCSAVYNAEETYPYRPPQHQKEQLSGPSWSWCSAYGPVSFVIAPAKRNFEFAWEIRGLRHGVLTIRCQLLRLKYRPEIPLTFTIPLDDCPHDFCEIGGEWMPDARLGYDGLPDLVSKDLFFLFAGSRKTKSSELCTGLIVEQLSGTEYCQRVGLVEAHVLIGPGRTGWATYYSWCEDRVVSII